jgi:hypothetical protein
MPNPFYIQPGGDFGPGLMGLSQTVSRVGEIKKAEKAQQDEFARVQAMKQGALEAFKSHDPDKIREFMISNPEMADTIKKTVETKLPGETADKYKNALFSALIDPSQAPKALEEMKTQLAADGLDPQEQAKIENLGKLIQDDPEKAQKVIASEYALLSTKDEWEKYKDITSPEAKTERIKNFEYYQQLLKDDPLGAATFSKVTGSEYAPSPLKKLIGERQALIDDGEDPNSPIIRAYDSKISGTDIDIENMTPDQIDTWGAYLNLTGKMPTLGRGKQSTKIRAQIVKSAAQQALGAKNFGEEDTEPTKTPAQAALDVVGSQADTKSIQGAQNFLEKQLSAMGSFVANIDMQVDKVKDLSKDLETFDTRLLNVPLRTLRGKIAGSPLQSKYDMYLTEIESEIGKLATGSAASIAELSTTAQAKWDKIHDKNLSVKDMLSLLEETRAAARMRVKSVETQLELARKKMRNRPESSTAKEPGVETSYTEGQTATGPNGEKIIFRNGSWEKL